MRKRLSLLLFLLVLALFSSAKAQTELKHTVKPAGQGGDFTSLAAAVNHLAVAHPNLVSANVYATMEISGTWSSPDTALVTVQNITTDSTHYIYIYTTAACRHPGYPDATKYRLVVAGGGAGCVTVACQYTRVEGLQLQNTTTWGDSVGLRVLVSNVRIYKCLATSAATNGFQDDDLGKATFYNCLGYNCHFAGFGLHGTCYNCTAVHNQWGFNVLLQPSVMKNCLAHGNTAADFLRSGSETITVTYCASSDATADDWGGAGNKINQTFTFVNHNGNDFHLAAGDTGARGFGATDPGSGLFNDDVDGQMRVAPWDIGFDQYFSAGMGCYVLDGYGGVHSGGGAPTISPSTPYFGFDIAKDIELTPSGTGYYVLDGYGGVHAGGSASSLTPKSPYFGWNIARDLELTPSGTGYYVLDGYGGVHAGGSASPLTPATPYFGWNIARDLELTPSGAGYYVLDGYGGVHTGGSASLLSPATPYFGMDIARDMELTASGTGYYVMDGYGGVHTGGSASPLSPTTPYFGWDIAKDLELTSGGLGYYVLDGYGGVHKGGNAPLLSPPTPYFNWNIARALMIRLINQDNPS